MAAETAGKASIENGMKTLEVSVKGPGAGREAAIGALQAAGLEVTAIRTLLQYHIMDAVHQNVVVFNFSVYNCIFCL